MEQTLEVPQIRSARAVGSGQKLFITSLDREKAHRYLAGWLYEKLETQKVKRKWVPCALFLKIYDQFCFNAETIQWRNEPLSILRLSTRELGEQLQYTNSYILGGLETLVEAKVLDRKRRGVSYNYFVGEDFPQLIESDKFFEIGREALKDCATGTTRQTRRKNRRGKIASEKTNNPIPLLPRPSTGNFTVLADQIVTDGLRTLTTAFNELIYDEGSKEIRQVSKNWMQLLTDIRAVSDIEDKNLATEMLDQVLDQIETILKKTCEFRKNKQVSAADTLLKQTHLLTANVYELRILLQNQYKMPDIQTRITAFKNKHSL